MLGKFYYIALIVSISLNSDARCNGTFVNPISDVCWECLFPITLGSFEIMGSDIPDTKNPSSPVCICKDPIIRMGLIGGFWEPARLIDVSHDPYCFVNMGGMEIDMGLERGIGARTKATSAKISQWYVHYYIYPILYLLELFKDFICIENASFDVAYVSELDPLGNDDELAGILHPEAFLFNNLAAQAACSADCVSAQNGLPIDSLFWCGGCQGAMFPFNGNTSAHVGGVQASLNIAQKQVFKMHRMGLAQEESASNAKDVCTKRVNMVMKKSTYRYQMVNPVPDTCQQFGKTSTTFEANKEIPITGEDFGYLIWKKINCCIF